MTTNIKTAILDHNPATNKWEATYDGMVICSGGWKEYVIKRIRNREGAMVRASGVTDFIDVSGYDAEMRAAMIKAPANEVQGLAEDVPQQPALAFGINERFDFVADFVEMVGNRKNASAVIVGSGGLGKSYTTFETLTKKCGLVQVDPTIVAETSDEDGDEDISAQDKMNAARAEIESQKGTFLVVKGYTTAKGLYRTLYENRNRVIVFDDCDMALKNETSANLLKAALDSYDRRVISWNAESSFGDSLPRSFEFFGGVVFISNMNMAQIPQAIISRSLTADVSMTRTEAIDRMRVIINAPEFMPEYSAELKTAALNFMGDNILRKEVADPNMRTLMSVIKIMAAGDDNCERRALYTMCSAR